MKTAEKIETNVGDTELACYDGDMDTFSINFDTKKNVEEVAKEWEQSPLEFLYRMIAASIHCLVAGTDDDLKDVWCRLDDIDKRLKSLEGLLRLRGGRNEPN